MSSEDRSMSEKLKALTEANWACMYVAAVVGVDVLALELERLGLSDEADLSDAAWTRPLLLEAAEQRE